MNQKIKKTILACIQPSGILHIGNYFGSIKQWINLQYIYQNCLFGIVDLHALSQNPDPRLLKEYIFQCIAQYIACGININYSNIFLQSKIIGHTELSWILSSLISMNRLKSMTQYKEKINNPKYNANVSLFTYPILMAADILLYNANYVPVGIDQIQHLELTREIAKKFNDHYIPFFNIPEYKIYNIGNKIMSLQSPLKKMSKSDLNVLGTIYLTDDADTIRKKIFTSVTDSYQSIKFNNQQFGIKNLLSIYHLISKKSIQELEIEYANQGYKKFKSDLIEYLINYLSPIQTKYFELMNNKDYLLQILNKGNNYAQELAFETLNKIKNIIGCISI